ncbi:Uncharacterised protein [Streptococcus pneumoniae]|nr:Uncharacterised protein [Streptococcus pneumoniae]
MVQWQPSHISSLRALPHSLAVLVYPGHDGQSGVRYGIVTPIQCLVRGTKPPKGKILGKFIRMAPSISGAKTLRVVVLQEIQLCFMVGYPNNII